LIPAEVEEDLEVEEPPPLPQWNREDKPPAMVEVVSLGVLSLVNGRGNKYIKEGNLLGKNLNLHIKF